MSNGPLAISSARGGRRSTRVNRAIQLEVGGIDSFRGPYQEKVSTVTVNCHGCMYESKYEVSPNATVILELNGNGNGAKSISTRGHVKWTQRPAERGDLYQTAIELDAPGNIWGIDSPPADWLPFLAASHSDTNHAKSKTIAVPPSQPTSTAAKHQARAADSAPASSTARSVGELMGGFQQQMEKVLSEAAETAVRDRATGLLDEMRVEFREEADRVIAETSSSKAGSWIDESVKKLNQIGEESVRTRHAQWTKKIEADLEQAIARMEARHRELEQASEGFIAKTQDKLQGLLEASRKDAVDRIVTRLKAESAPVIDSARKAAEELTRREEEVEKVCRQYVEASASQLEESCARLDKQFEMILRERLDTCREELERAAASAANSAIDSVRASASREESDAQHRLQDALEPITQNALVGLKEKAADISRQFAGELSNYSRSHLEFVSGAIADLAKGIGKLSNS